MDGGGHVFTHVCLFVCLCAGYLKKLWTDLDEIWWTGWVLSPYVLGHMVWQPYWIQEKIIGHHFLRNHLTKKIETWHMSSTSHGVYRVITMTSSVKSFYSRNWFN